MTTKNQIAETIIYAGLRHFRKSFDNMELVYNDIHMEYCNKTQESLPGMIEINVCVCGESALADYLSRKPTFTSNIVASHERGKAW